jgi:hypothetical protein
MTKYDVKRLRLRVRHRPTCAQTNDQCDRQSIDLSDNTLEVRVGGDDICKYDYDNLVAQCSHLTQGGRGGGGGTGGGAGGGGGGAVRGGRDGGGVGGAGEG